MNIVYVLSGTGLTGGATKAFISILKKVCNGKNNVLVVCPDKDGIYEYLRSNKDFPNCEVVALPYMTASFPPLRKPIDYVLYIPRIFKRWIKNWGAATKLIARCRTFKPDIVHTNTSVNDIGFLVSRKFSVPHVWHIREYGDKRFGFPFQKRMINASNNYNIAITKDLINYKGLKDNPRSVVIYDGPIKEIHTPEPDHDKYFFFAGRLTKSKGIYDLMDAYIEYTRQCNGKPFKLKLAGAVPEEDLIRLNNIIESNNLIDLVEILGPQDDLSELYRHAALVIMPSLVEGFGFVLPEAMSFGALTAGRNLGGMKIQYDLGLELTGKEIGLRFENTQQLTGLMLNVTAEPKSKYRDKIERAQHVVSQLYTTEISVNQVLDLYNRILGNKP